VKPKGWDEFQHYKNRRPAWIKLHHKLLDNADFHALKGEDAKYLVLIWLIASEEFGEVPPLAELAFRLRISEKQCEQLASRLQAWFENPASKTLASCKQVASPEEEREKEGEEEKETPLPRNATPQSEDCRILCEMVGIFGMREQAELLPCLRKYAASSGKSVSDSMLHMEARWNEVKKASPRLEWQWGSAYTFFMSGKWDDPRAWPWKPEAMLDVDAGKRKKAHEDDGNAYLAQLAQWKVEAQGA
jgi:hypothetical protein